MPIPGPRTQTGPDPGYRNPGREQPNRFNPWLWPFPTVSPGRSPGTMFIALRGNVLGFGQIRLLWRQAINYFPAAGAYSWTTSENDRQGGPPLGITRALRYMTRSVYAAAGDDNTRYAGLHTVVPKYNRGKQVTVGAGQRRNPPTLRNRNTSFGQRVPPLNNRGG